MTTAMQLFISIWVPWILGYACILYILGRVRLPFLLILSLSFGMGLGVLCQWMLFLGMLRVPYHLDIIGIPLIIITVLFFAAYLFNRKKAAQQPRYLLPEKTQKKGTIFWLSFFYVIFVVFVAFWMALTIPVFSWDAFATVAFKAKILFIEKTLAFLPYSSHAAYPLHTPFVEAWIAFNLGIWDDQLIKIVFPLTLCSFLLINYVFLRYFMDNKWALFGCFLFCSSAFFVAHATISYRDFFMAYYNALVVILILLWRKFDEDRLLFLASLFAGFATFVKIEGQLYLGISILLVVLLLMSDRRIGFRKKINKSLLFLIPSLLIWLNYFVYNRLILGIMVEQKGTIELGWEQLGRINDILNKLFIDCFYSGNWNFVWYLLVFSLCLQLEKVFRSQAIKILLFLLLCFLGNIILLGTLTASYVWLAGKLWYQTLSRLVLHFYPVCVWLVVLLNAPMAPHQEQKQDP